MSSIVDDEAAQEAASWIGRTLRIELSGTEASRDGVRRFAHGIGDLNPLYCDIAYGRRTRFGTNLAPPTFLYSIYYAPTLPGLPRLHAVNAGATWRYHERVRVGDQLRAEATVIEGRLVTGRSGARRILQTGLIRYLRCNAPGEETCVAELEESYLRMADNRDPSSGLHAEPRAPTEYAPEELDAIATEALAAIQVRGAQPRYPDEVSVGDSLGTLVKGPYSLADQLAYYVGEGGKNRRAFEASLEAEHRRRSDPASAPNDMDPARRAHSAHFDAAEARSVGMPGAYDDGHQRVGSIANLVTNWMGDDGFLRALEVRHRGVVITGDVIRVSGEVQAVNEHAVIVDLAAHNQFGAVVSTGRATVELACRRS